MALTVDTTYLKIFADGVDGRDNKLVDISAIVGVDEVTNGGTNGGSPARFARVRIEDSSQNRFASTAYFAKPCTFRGGGIFRSPLFTTPTLMAGPCAQAIFLVSKVARPTWANRTIQSHISIFGCITGGVGVPFLSGVVGNSVGVPSFSGIDVINITYNGMIL